MGIEPAPGDVSLWSELLEFLIPYRNERKYFEQWLAYPLQHLGAKLKVAVILHSSTQGLGKNILLEPVQQIYGDNARSIKESDLLAPFNTWQKDRQFIVGDEIQGGRKPKAVIEQVKLLITSPTVSVNEKFKPAFDIPNVANFVFVSNNPDPFYLADQDRRFFVPQLTDAQPKSDAFYRKFHDWKASPEGVAALHDHLLHVDLTDFSPDEKAPMTNAKQEMIELGHSDLDRWVRDLLDDTSRTLYSVDALLAEYRARNLNAKISNRDMLSALSKARFKRPCEGEQIRVGKERKKVRLWATPDGFRAIEKRKLTPTQVGELYDKQMKRGVLALA